jgi:predicted transcriptional regulator
MACPRQDVTGTELAILRVLWKHGPATTRAIMERLYPGGGAAHYATVQSLLARLAEKSLVRRSHAGKARLHAAAIGRDELLGRRLKALAEALCDGSLNPLLTQLVKAQKLTPEERRRLREILDEDAGSPGRRRQTRNPRGEK